MSATQAQVEAAHRVFACFEILRNDHPHAATVCANRDHQDDPWTDFGCPVAVGIADTIADAT